MKNLGRNLTYLMAAGFGLLLAIGVDSAGIDDVANKGAATSAQKAHELNEKAQNYKESKQVGHEQG